MFLNAYLTLLVVKPLNLRFTSVEIQVVLVDLGLGILLLIIALRSDKFWPLWLTAMQMLGTLAHFAPFVPHIIPWSYGTAVAMWMYPMLIVLFMATRNAYHHRRTMAA